MAIVNECDILIVGQGLLFPNKSGDNCLLMSDIIMHFGDGSFVEKKNLSGYSGDDSQSKYRLKILLRNGLAEVRYTEV